MAKTVNRLFVCCLFSRIIGNNFPLSIYIHQSINYNKDVLIGEEVIGEVEVVKNLGKNKYEIKTICKNTEGVVLVEGTAVILQ
jgi:acyl dehydratase